MACLTIWDKHPMIFPMIGVINGHIYIPHIGVEFPHYLSKDMRNVNVLIFGFCICLKGSMGQEDGHWCTLSVGAETSHLSTSMMKKHWSPSSARSSHWRALMSSHLTKPPWRTRAKLVSHYLHCFWGSHYKHLTSGDFQGLKMIVVDVGKLVMSNTIYWIFTSHSYHIADIYCRETVIQL